MPGLFSGRRQYGAATTEETYERPKWTSLKQALKERVEKVKEWFQEDKDSQVSQAGGNKEDHQGVSEIDFEKLFELKKVGENYTKKLSLTQTRYDVKIAPLTKYYDNIQSMVIMPKTFDAILKVCTKDFQPFDRLIIELSCEDLDPSIYLHVRHFKNFNIDLLMAQLEKLNSSKKFKVDKSFRIRLTRVSNFQGGNVFTYIQLLIATECQDRLLLFMSDKICAFLRHYALANLD